MTHAELVEAAESLVDKGLMRRDQQRPGEYVITPRGRRITRRARLRKVVRWLWADKWVRWLTLLLAGFALTAMIIASIAAANNPLFQGVSHPGSLR